jgi:hypothetical protein
MPQTIEIATFVFGAVLLLIGLFGGGFEIFGNKIPGKIGKLGRLFAFVLGLILIGKGLGDRMPSPPEVPPTSHPGGENQQPVSNPWIANLPVDHPSINGYWQDGVGTTYIIAQNGNTFQFSGGNAWTGLQSNGTGTISGNQIAVSFRTNLPSTGRGSLTLSGDGRLMTGMCSDSVQGAYALAISRY